MNAQKFTQKSLEAIQSAQSLAIQYQNMQIDQVHLLHALSTQEGGLISQMLLKMNVDAEAFAAACQQEIARLPKVSGSGREMDKVYVSRDVDAALVESEQQAERMKDEYVSVEHLFLAMLEKPNAAARRVFQAFHIE